MKILEVTNVDFSLRQFLLPLMRGARDRGHEVVGVCAEGPLLDVVRAEGFRVIPVPFERQLSPPAHLRALRRMVGVIRAEKPDLVHAHMPISAAITRLAARFAGDTARRLYLPRLPVQPGRLLAAPPGRAGDGTRDRADNRRVPDRVRERGAGRAPARARPAAPVAVGNGRDPAVYHPDPAARRRLRAEFGTPEGRPVVIAVSRLVATKGYPELAEAMRAVPEAELWVVGNRLASDRGEDMAALLSKAGLDGRLRLLGYREDVAALLAAADIFVLPSHYEGLPMSVIEAMLTGLPVIASDLPGTREQVVPKVTGLLVPRKQIAPLAAALQRLVGDPDLRTRMGEAGRARALDRFNERIVVARTLDLLGL